MSDTPSKATAGSGTGGADRATPQQPAARGGPAAAGAGASPMPPGASPPGSGMDERGTIARGKVSATWIGLIIAALVLVLLIIFIAQNLSEAPIHFFGASGNFPIGLSLLIAAIGGILLAGVPGTVRILQLRRALRNRRAGRNNSRRASG